MIISIFFGWNRIKSPIKEVDGEEVTISGRVISYEIDGDLWKGTVQNKNKYIFYYKIKDEEEKHRLTQKVVRGMYVKFRGTLSLPEKNGNRNLFQYADYLKSIGIFYKLDISNYEFLDQSIGVWWKIRNQFHDHFSHYQSPYLNALLLGETEYLDTRTNDAINNMGIQHLFSVSGLHFHTLILLIQFLMRSKSKRCQMFFQFCIMFGYASLIGFTPSVSRVIVFHILSFGKRLFGINCTTLDVFLLTFLLILSFHPYQIYHIGFQFSFLITFFLIWSTPYIRYHKYRFLLLSVLIFLVSVPISSYHFYEVSLLSPLYNFIFVPIVSVVLFPFCILVFFFPLFLPLFQWCMNIFDQMVVVLGNISIGTVIVGKPTLVWCFFYYVFFFIGCYNISKKKYTMWGVVAILLFYQSNVLMFSNTFQYHTIDVGQGDASLLIFPHRKKAVMIDTGGQISYQKEKWRKKKQSYNMSKYILIPYLKSVGVQKIETLILTHGDYDHMGEAMVLTDNFKVGNVIFNCGEFNDLEQELIKVLDKKKIKYYSCIKKLNIDKYKLQFLNTREYDNENDNSSVIYLNYNNYKFLFMGDAGIKKEKDILEKYHLKNIDFLKVGHHGSKTSSSEVFVNSINPKYSIISVGKNNRYGHPEKSVLHTLSNRRIYRTDLDGSIEIKLNKNGYKIRTCPP